MVVEVFPRHAVGEHAVERTSFAVLTREAEAEWDGVGAFTGEMRAGCPTHTIAIEEDFAVGHQQLAPLVVVEVFPRHAVGEHTVERASFAVLAREAEAEWNGVGAFTSEMRTRSPTHAVAVEEDFAVGHRGSPGLKRSPAHDWNTIRTLSGIDSPAT
ncbi:MAG TPA: hypothetical protein VG106_12495, partial [Vicinamibacterales bacterium]|nr:hypothetical protein [Vicinamibacterales bacterium]